MADEETGESIEALRAKFRVVTGKAAPPNMGEAKLRARIEAAEKVAETGESIEADNEASNSISAGVEAAAAQPPNPPPNDEPGKQVILMCAHVYLPNDVLADDWFQRPTVKVAGKDPGGQPVRMRVHPGLASFLHGRGQAVIV